MNKKTPRTISQVSQAVTELMPNIIRGVQMDFFSRGRITQSQFFMLVAIQATGRCAMGTLARNMRIKLPTATGLVQRLAASGHVRRVSDANDRRKVYVEITTKGAKFFEEFRVVMRRRWEEVLVLLDSRELASFYEAVTKLRDRLKAGPSV